MGCEECIIACVSCADFESKIQNEYNIEALKLLRKSLMAYHPVASIDISGRIADFIVSKVGTMFCVYLFIIMVTIPLIFPQTMSVVQYISSGYLQLILLPLIMVSQNRDNKVRDMKAEREYRMLLIADRIDELLDAVHHGTD